MSKIGLRGDVSRVSLPNNIKFIAIEGVIGVGKTTLAQIISKKLNAQLVSEEFDANPFLDKFYSNRKSFAFQTQMFFLLSRHKQYKESFSQNDLFSQINVSDYTMDKDMIFASQNLNEDEFNLYNKMAAALNRDVVQPDYVVYLRANVETLMNRIKKRGRSMERNIDPNYLIDLTAKYDHHFFHYNKCPILIINTDNIDFVEKQNDLSELIAEIENVPIERTIYTPDSI